MSSAYINPLDQDGTTLLYDGLVADLTFKGQVKVCGLSMVECTPEASTLLLFGQFLKTVNENM